MTQDTGRDERSVAGLSGAQVPPASGGAHAPNSATGGVYGQPAWQVPAYAAASEPPQRKSRAWIVALVAVVCIFLLLLFGMMSCSRTVSSLMSIDTGASSALDSVAGDAVGVITIDGTISYDGSTSSPEGLADVLDAASADDRIVAVVLRVNSGGGAATAGEEMAELVRDFDKPVVVSSASMNSSAAYEISSQADYIFTAKTTSIGSIGTAMEFTDLSGLYEMLGITNENITSAPSKDSSYGTRGLTDEERAYYQGIVDQNNDVFVQNVADGRGMTTDEVRALATGLSFTGLDAVENGLADEIGTLKDAVAKAAELAGSDTTQMVDLEPEYTYDLTSLLGVLSESDVSASDVERLAEALEGKEGGDDVVAN